MFLRLLSQRVTGEALKVPGRNPMRSNDRAAIGAGRICLHTTKVVYIQSRRTETGFAHMIKICTQRWWTFSLSGSSSSARRFMSTETLHGRR